MFVIVCLFACGWVNDWKTFFDCFLASRNYPKWIKIFLFFGDLFWALKISRKCLCFYMLPLSMDSIWCKLLLFFCSCASIHCCWQNIDLHYVCLLIHFTMKNNKFQLSSQQEIKKERASYRKGNFIAFYAQIVIVKCLFLKRINVSFWCSFRQFWACDNNQENLHITVGFFPA